MRRLKPNAGLVIRGQRGNPVVRRALVRFARWARVHYEFPVHVPVYLHEKERHFTREKQWVSASFFAPYSRFEQPYIRIATGDYPSLRQARGRNDALAAFILSLCHEIVHYHQWIETGQTKETGVLVRAKAMLQRYSDFARRP
jgi:hypothetical protein